MIDLEKLKEKITHKGGECCDFEAYKIDSAGGIGLSRELQFKDGQVSQVDYFIQDDNNVYLIELSDLQDDIKSSERAKLILDDTNVTFSEVLEKSPKKAEKIIQGKIWSDVISEFQKKWLGSIAIMERYFRYNQYSNNPFYQLIIVVKNSQDIDELNYLKQNLSGMMGKVIVLKTDMLPLFLKQKMKQ